MLHLHYGCAIGVVSFINYDSREACLCLPAGPSVKLIKKYFMKKCQTRGRQRLIYDWFWHGWSLQPQKFMGQRV